MMNLHPIFTQALAPWAPPPRYAETFCSQCGAELGPGNAGVSHCSDHRRPGAPEPQEIQDLRDKLWEEYDAGLDDVDGMYDREEDEE